MDYQFIFLGGIDSSRNVASYVYIDIVNKQFIWSVYTEAVNSIVVELYPILEDQKQEGGNFLSLEVDFSDSDYPEVILTKYDICDWCWREG